MNNMVDSIFLELSTRFQGPSPTNVDVSEKPLRVLRLITRLSTATVATKSYELFETIMRSGVAQEKKMEAARLALGAAYQQRLEFAPPVGDPKHILDFLDDHIAPGVKDKDHINAVSSVMRAIDSTADDPTSQSWTWHMGDAGEILTGLELSPHPAGFEWWYRVLWVHYGGLDRSVQKRLDKIAINGDDRVDLKWCRATVEKEIERAKELVGGTAIVALEDVYRRLTAIIDHREKVRDGLRAFGQDSFPLFSSSRGYQPRLSHGQLIFILYGIIGGRVSPPPVDHAHRFF